MPLTPDVDLWIEVRSNVAGLNVTYASSGGVTLGVGVGTASIPITVPAGITTVIATVTDALGVTNTIQKDISCT